MTFLSCIHVYPESCFEFKCTLNGRKNEGNLYLICLPGIISRTFSNRSDHILEDTYRKSESQWEHCEKYFSLSSEKNTDKKSDTCLNIDHGGTIWLSLLCFIPNPLAWLHGIESIEISSFTFLGEDEERERMKNENRAGGIMKI